MKLPDGGKWYSASEILAVVRAREPDEPWPDVSDAIGAFSMNEDVIVVSLHDPETTRGLVARD